MSTTRPLLGMKRVTDLSCSDQPGTRLPATSGQQHNHAPTVDEFTVVEDKQEELKCAKAKVEQVFKVVFTIIGLLDHAGQAYGSKTTRQIWLQLKGNREDVSKAKEYVRGLCDPELQKEERYPVDMHCIFAGARGLFLDRLLRDTSAEVQVVEPGRLRLLGRAEPVVMAQSRVQQFVALFQEKRSLPGDREPSVKRAFKSFVEEREDKFTMELLLLPSALKEELLGLAQSPTAGAHTAALAPASAHHKQQPPGQRQGQPPAAAEVDQDRSQSSTPVTELSNRILDTSFEEKGTTTAGGAGATAVTVGVWTGPGPEAALLNGGGGRPSHKRRSSDSEMRDTKRQYSLERRDESPERHREREGRGVSCTRSKTPSASSNLCFSSTTTTSSSALKANTVVGPVVHDSGDCGSDDGEAVSPETNLRCLVNFFRTMGYRQEVVESVVKEMGQTEDTFLLLERIVEETKLCDRKPGGEGTGGKLSSVHSPDAPSTSSSSSLSTFSRSREKERALNRAPTEAGRSKENIKPSGCSNGLGHRRQRSGSETSTQQAITIKRSSTAQAGAGNYEVITIYDDDDDDNPVAMNNSALPGGRSSRTTPMEHPDTQSGSRMDYLARGAGGVPSRDYLSRGGTHTLGGPMKVESVTALRSAPQWLTATTTSLSSSNTADQFSRPSASPYQTIGHTGFHAGGVRFPLANEPPIAPVTGLARFHQSLRTPYTLTLPNEPGRPELRHVIIDGSNIAMAHGLHRFFSCRGIALAVEVFWKRGHREITVFVPQWRQKRDQLTTEQHFLNQLEDLRLLSFTPSREVCGQRIASHDDRFLLHLAEKTDGVIVTNDNLRDFVNTSTAWRRIIQERLLQYTFVEDLFMIPDDPLGKRGPHLEIFLLKDGRPPATPPPVRSYQQHQATFTPQPGPTRAPSLPRWPHTGPPEWHKPRRSLSPSPAPPPQRSPGETSELKRKLYDIFPGQEQRIDRILTDNPYMRDLNALSALLLG